MIEIDVCKKVSLGRNQAELKFECVFQTGAVTRVSGPSGAGKTSLLKILAGLIIPDHGTIKVEGNTWFDSSLDYSKKIQARRLGFVFQDYALFPKMTVAQHLEYGSNDPEYIGNLLCMGKLQHLRGRFPRELSGGQQQRLSLLRALVTRPSLLLMDEPFSAMDKALKADLVEELKPVFSALGATVIIVTHDSMELENLHAHTIYLEQQL